MPAALGAPRRSNDMAGIGAPRGRIRVFEVCIQRVHVHPDMLVDGHPDRIDPDKGSPLIMSFQTFHGLAPHPVHASRLAEIPAHAYRSPDIDRSREAGMSVDAARR